MRILLYITSLIFFTSFSYLNDCDLQLKIVNSEYLKIKDQAEKATTAYGRYRLYANESTKIHSNHFKAMGWVHYENYEFNYLKLKNNEIIFLNKIPADIEKYWLEWSFLEFDNIYEQLIKPKYFLTYNDGKCNNLHLLP